MKLMFMKVKETKNTVKLEEQPEEGKPAVIGTLYVQKWYMGTAETITLTIEKGK